MGEGELVKGEGKGGAGQFAPARVVCVSTGITRANGYARYFSRIDYEYGSESRQAEPMPPMSQTDFQNLPPPRRRHRLAMTSGTPPENER